MAAKPGQHVFQPPTGTRDFYPADLLRRRYIEKAWRDTAIRHGFEEIDGPTFEHLDLYTVKSGEGIVSELFSFQREGGEKTYALRPEFTPTLARMYAAKAASLPKPTKWFWQQNCFRAERPQRGRLREFGQWNCDIIGEDSPAADAEAIACSVEMLRALHLTPADVRIRVSHRSIVNTMLEVLKIPEGNRDAAVALLDRRSRLSPAELQNQSLILSLPIGAFDNLTVVIQSQLAKPEVYGSTGRQAGFEHHFEFRGVRDLWDCLRALDVQDWCTLDVTVVRGLAYYTGMVFEVHEATGAERAIAGGGRYDNLIELFGGPPTPAVGFGMGDVVLSMVLQDKGLMPTDDKLLEKLGEPTPYRPDVFVLSNGTEPADAAVPGVVAALRRAGLHARRTYKTSKNLGKLLKDASAAGSRFAAILDSPSTCALKNLDTGAQEDGVPVSEIAVRAKAAQRTT